MATTKVQSELIVDDVALAGNPTTSTQSAGNNTTRIATTAFVTTAVNNLIDSAPGTMDTLNEIAAALGDDPSFTTTVNNAIATKLPLAGGTMTGNIAHASDFTIDAGGDIILDADGGDIRFKDGGTEIAVFENSSSDLQIKASVQDKDIIFRGNDGGSGINALVLDMSEAGKATFNAGASFADDVAINNGSPELYFGTTGNHYNWRIAAQENTDASLQIDVGSQDTDYSNDSYSSLVTVKNDGKVGIGTTSPASMLHIKSTASDASASLIFENTNNAQMMNIDYYNNVGAVQSRIGYDEGPGAFSFKPNVSSTAMYIAYDGSVGIGTTSPDYALDIENSSTHAIMRLHAGANSSASLRLQNDSQHWDVNCQTTDTFAIYNQTTSTQPFTINTDGYVTLNRNANEYGLELKSAGTRSGIVLKKPATDSIMGSLLMLSNETYALGTASYYHQNMLQNGFTQILGGGTVRLTVDTTGVDILGGRIRNSTANGTWEVRTGGRNGTGTYTLFTNGSSTTQSAGIVEVWGIYGTPSGASYSKYVIGGNRSIATIVNDVQTNSVPNATVSWNGADLEVTNSDASLYYHVRVELHDIGNGWVPTWGDFPDIS